MGFNSGFKGLKAVCHIMEERSHFLQRYLQFQGFFNTFKFSYEIWWQIVKIFRKWQMWVTAMGSWFLYDALFNVWYCVVFSYLVMYYGDRVLGHLGSISPVHFMVCSIQDFIWGVNFGWMAVWVLSPDRRNYQPKTCDC